VTSGRTGSGRSTEEWFAETLYPDFQQRLLVSRVLHRQKTPFQDLCILETPRFGRVLTLDGVVQTTEADEFCYHEMLTHVPIVAHGAARKVLIIGGGDGGVLREALRHKAIEKAVMVEIDGGVVEACRTHMPSLSAGAFEDPRTELLIADGFKYVKETPERFDVVIVDSTDPHGPAVPLFDDGFYADVRARHTERGIVVCQSGIGFMQPDEARGTCARMRRLFADGSLYMVQVPTYAAGIMLLGWGAMGAEARQTPLATLERRYREAGIATRYYSPAIHAACFSLPPYLEALKG
jgi:spermidine synthase